jgi:hypothetical protein
MYSGASERPRIIVYATANVGQAEKPLGVEANSGKEP